MSSQEHGLNPAPPLTSHNPKSTRASTLCLWYLRSIHLGTQKDLLVSPGTIIKRLPDLPDDTFHRTFMYLKRYADWVRDRDAALKEKATPEKMNELPLALSFFVALELARNVQAGLCAPPHGEGAQADFDSLDFSAYGFVDPKKQRHRCYFHGIMDGKTIITRGSVMWINKRCHPKSEIMKCGPEICIEGMTDLYIRFKHIVLGKRSATSETEAAKFTEFKVKFLREEYIAKVCTGYLLKEVNFGMREPMLRTPWELFQTMHEATKFPWRTYAGALFLLHKYRASERFGANPLNDVGLDLIFYATLAITIVLIGPTHHESVSVISIFERLGFSRPLEKKTARILCRTHTRAQACRAKVNKSFVISPGPVTSGISAREYMGCDESVVCTDGMMRLRDYMLAAVFKWDINLQLGPNKAEFFAFEKEVKERFGRGVMLGQTLE